ncbi:MAG: alpha/beta hydrolase [Brevinema sp.]
MIYYMISISLFIFMLLMTQTMLFFPNSTEKIFTEQYSSTKDIWYKKTGNKNLVIALHGMYGYPSVFNELGKTLLQKDWDMYAPTLPNSVEIESELTTQRPYQWNDSLKVALRKILEHSGNYENIVLLGHSQGGSLAMALAPSLSFIKHLVVIASPINLLNKHFSLTKNIQIIFSGLVHFTKKKGLFVKSHINPEAKDWYFGLTIHSFQMGLKETRKHLHDITAKTLLIYEKSDPTVPFSNMKKISEKIHHVEMKVFDTPLDQEITGSRHDLLNFEPIKEQVIDTIIKFINK